MTNAISPFEAACDVPLPGLESLPVTEPAVRPVAARPRVSDPALVPTERTVASFWSHVIRTPGNGCALWARGAISSPDGYGRFSYSQGDRQRTVSAHRFAMELVAGPLDDGVVCEHKCNEPLCVRVDADHVVLSTQSENVRYAVALGRMAGHTPLDQSGRTRYQRSLDIREALANGYNPEALYAARLGHGPQALLF